MSLKPDSYQEFLARKKRQDQRRREAVQKYRDKVRDEVLSGEREWSSLSPVNRERRRKRFEEAFESEERVLWMQSLPCIVCGDSPSEVAHVTSRGAGGGPDDTVPLCPFHHRRQHDMGIRTFEKEYGLALEAEAAYHAGLWRHRQEEGADE